MKHLDPALITDIMLLLMLVGALLCVANGDYPQI